MARFEYLGRSYQADLGKAPIPQRLIRPDGGDEAPTLTSGGGHERGSYKVV